MVTAYDLDGAGNRNEVAIDAVAESYTQIATAPDPADAPMNQYTQAPGDTADRVYDENGNLLQTGAATPATFRHDYLDHIVDMDDGATYAVYEYDALGRRIEKTVDDGTTATTTRYLHDGARVAEEWDVPAAGSPTLSASYVYGLYIDEVLTMRRGGVDYYYHADDQHNVVKLTDNTGTLLEAYDYADYGQPEFYDAAGAPLTASQFGNPYLFTGRAWDPELGYYYFRNRYLDPAHGRFASRDPLGLWGDPLNLGNGYTYAGSNPWSLVDPFGLEAGGNSFWGNFFGALTDWTTYRDYALFSYGEAALGVGDWAVDTGERAVDTVRMTTNPLYAYERAKEGYATLAAIASDPVAAYDAMGSALHEYLSDFDARDAGKLLPDVVASVLGAGGSRAARSAADAADAAGTAARTMRRMDNVVPGGLCFAAGTLVLVDGGFTPIEQLDVGDRVITTNNTPDLSATEVDPATWRALDLLMEDPRAPGYAIELTVLRSDAWIEATRAREGGWIDFTLPEMGVEGAARVMGVRPCPPIDDGPGRVVLATIQSTSATVLDLHIEGLAAPLQPTAAHPFYSLDRSDWIPAGQLSAGERIRGLLEPVVVTDVTTRVGFHQVYNLEVEADHCYAVSDGLVLSHNTNPCAAPLPPNRGNGGRGGGLDHAWVQQHIEDKAGGTQEVRMDLGRSNLYRIVDNLDAKGTIHQVGTMRQRGGFRPSADQRGAIEDLRKAYPNARIIFHDKMGQLPSLINPDLQPGWKPAPSKYRKW